MIIRLISTSATPKDLKGDKLRKLNSDKKTAAKLLEAARSIERIKSSISKQDKSTAKGKTKIAELKKQIEGIKDKFGKVPSIDVLSRRVNVLNARIKKSSTNTGRVLPVSGRGMMTDKQRKKLQSKSASLKENFESALGEELFEAQGTPQAAPIFKRFMGFSPVSGSQVGIGSSDVYRTDQGGWVFLITPNKDRMVLLVQLGTPSLDKQLFTKRRPNDFLVYADRNLEGGPSDGYINPVPGTIVTFTTEDSAKSYFKHLMKADLADIESQFRQVNTDPRGQKNLKAWDSNL